MAVKASTKDRVWEAADALLAEGQAPTVAAVRDRARCSNTDATAHLRTWRAAQSDEAETIPPVPDGLQPAFAQVWRTAVLAARQEHTAAASAAEQAVREARAEVDDLARQADKVETERAKFEAEVDRLTRELDQAQRDVDAARQAREAADREAREARDTAAEANAARAAAEGVATGLREALAATNASTRKK